MNGAATPSAHDDLPLNATESTLQPHNPNVRFDSHPKRVLSEGEWNALSTDLYQAVTASLSSRAALDANLREWEESYSLLLGQKDFPFVDSSNIRLPFTAAQLESLLAYVVGQVMVPRMYIVRGNTQMAAQSAAKVERFYNDEYVRLRPDGASYFMREKEMVHLGLRDGTGIIELLWSRQRERKEIVTWRPVTDPQSGVAILDPETGEPKWEEHRQVGDVISDYPKEAPVPLKEFILIPSESRSIEEAAGVARVEWLYESQLDAMVRSGLMDHREVERALAYVPTGTSGVAQDRQGSYDKSASGQIGIGQGQGSLSSRFFTNRGPIKVWRIHSRQFDLNGDGIPEENIFWLDELGQRMLGWTPYDYTAGKRPFFAFCPFPRPDQFYGFSLIERLSGIQAEMDGQHNARNDRTAFDLFPPMAVEAGSLLLTQRGQWRPGAWMEMERVGQNQSANLFQLPPMTPYSVNEEMLLKQYGSEYTGLDNPGMGAQSSGRRSATEMQRRSQAAGVRLNLICFSLRVAAGQIAGFRHALNKDFLRVDPSTLDPATQTEYKLPLGVLTQDYTIAVAGASDPIDSTTAKQEFLGFFELAVKTMPDIMQDPVFAYAWRSILVDKMGYGEMKQQLIGSEQDAQQRKEALAQQMQAQMAMQQAQTQHLQNKGGQPQPGQQPQRPQPQAQPGPQG